MKFIIFSLLLLFISVVSEECASNYFTVTSVTRSDVDGCYEPAEDFDLTSGQFPSYVKPDDVFLYRIYPVEDTEDTIRIEYVIQYANWEYYEIDCHSDYFFFYMLDNIESLNERGWSDCWQLETDGSTTSNVDIQTIHLLSHAGVMTDNPHLQHFPMLSVLSLFLLLL